MKITEIRKVPKEMKRQLLLAIVPFDELHISNQLLVPIHAGLLPVTIFVSDELKEKNPVSVMIQVADVVQATKETLPFQDMEIPIEDVTGRKARFYIQADFRHNPLKLGLNQIKVKVEGQENPSTLNYFGTDGQHISLPGKSLRERRILSNVLIDAITTVFVRDETTKRWFFGYAAKSANDSFSRPLSRSKAILRACTRQYDVTDMLPADPATGLPTAETFQHAAHALTIQFTEIPEEILNKSKKPKVIGRIGGRKRAPLDLSIGASAAEVFAQLKRSTEERTAVSPE